MADIHQLGNSVTDAGYVTPCLAGRPSTSKNHRPLWAASERPPPLFSLGSNVPNIVAWDWSVKAFRPVPEMDEARFLKERRGELEQGSQSITLRGLQQILRKLKCGLAEVFPESFTG